MRVAQRTPRAPAPPSAHLALLLLVTLAAAASADYQRYVLCKNPTSRICRAWPVMTEFKDVEVARASEVSGECGLYNLPRDTSLALFTTRDNGEITKVFCFVILTKREHRVRRQTGFGPRGRYRGQTQSQYLAVDRGGKDEGKAEAHSAADSSRASVSGNSGMGQAQSQSVYDPSCEDCYSRVDKEEASLKKRPQGAITSGFSGYRPEQKGGSDWAEPPNRGSPTGNTYGINQNVRPGLDNYGLNQPSATNYEQRFEVPRGGNSFTPTDAVNPGLDRNRGFGPIQTGLDRTGPGREETYHTFRPGLRTPISEYGPSQQGNGGYGPNHSESGGGARPEQGNTYGPLQSSHSVGYGPGQAGIPGGENYPPGSLMNPPGRGGISTGPRGPMGADGGILPQQIASPDGSFSQIPQRGPSYGTGEISAPGVYGPGQNGAFIPGINGGPLQGGSRNTMPGGQGNVGIYNPRPVGTPGELGEATPGATTVPQGIINRNQGSVSPPNNQIIPSGGLNTNGGSWPIASYGSGNSPYFCCVVGPDGNLIAAGESPFGRGTGPGTNNQYPNVNSHYGYGGPGNSDQNGVIGPGQGIYGSRSPGNGINNLGQSTSNNYGPAQGTGSGNFRPGTGQIPISIGSYSPGGYSAPSGGENYNPNVNVGSGDRSSYGPGTTGVGGSFIPNPGRDQSRNYRPGLGGTPSDTTSFGVGQGIVPTQAGNYGPAHGSSTNIGRVPSQSVPKPEESYGPGSNNGYGPRQDGVPGRIGNYGSGHRLPGDVGSYGPGPSMGGSYGLDPGISTGGSGYRPDQGNEPANIRNYGPGQAVGPGGGGFGLNPSDRTGFVRNYGPDQTSGPGSSSFGSSPGVGSYEPRQTNGIGGSYIGPNLGVGLGTTGSYGPGHNIGGGNGDYGNYGPAQNTGPGGYRPGESGVGSYGTGSGLGPGQSTQDGRGGYMPYQGINPGGQGSYRPVQTSIGSYEPSPGGTPGDGYGSAQGPADRRRVNTAQPIYGSDITDLYGNSPDRPGNGYNPKQMGQNVDYTGVPQNFTDPSNLADGDDSEAQASVSQNVNGTTASGSARGGNDKGRAQTNVQGTYTGSGSFSAQAQITGENKEAESEVSGGKKGASSSAQGSGRNNKSQANVQLGSETGSVQTQSLTNGAYHSSNSQVQGSVKGGMADAQARGPGSTSSQAQIGFTPYKDGDKSHDTQEIPFVGGGVASAQSSGRTGQSQSQLHGTFRYGITYNGAAQAGSSVDKDAVFPNRLSFDKINVFDENEKNINIDTEKPKMLDAAARVDTTPSFESMTEEESVPPEDESTTESRIPSLDAGEVTEKNEEALKNSESRYGSHTHLDHHKTIDSASSPPPTAGETRSFQPKTGSNGGEYEYTTDKEEVPPDEYDATEEEQGEYINYDDIPRDTLTHQSLQIPSKDLDVRQTTGGNTQHIVLGSLHSQDAEITQKNSERPDETKTYQPGEKVPGTGGYTIPAGFTGSVSSVASKEETYVVGSKESPSQAQTVTLTPGSGKVKFSYPTTYGRVGAGKLRSLSPRPRDDRFVSVSKSVTRDLDAENNVRKQYSHSYYTKSSSCGFFTFTCTMVSGAEGKKKVCKPKIPTNPDGTPIRC